MNRFKLNLRYLLFFILLGHVLVGDLWCTQPVSGNLVNGFRVLSVEDLAQSDEFSVYRGDYIKFDMGTHRRAVLSIPALGIETELDGSSETLPYFKMKKAGIFDFFLGEISATLRVVEYTAIHYKAVSAEDAQQILGTFSPLVLDVRTPKEYKMGHLDGSRLIPVQELKTRINELDAYKHDPILVYCATGNRSTVASKLLIDSGFTRIFNLRHGIVDWYRKKYPVVIPK